MAGFWVACWAMSPTLGTWAGNDTSNYLNCKK